MFVERKLQAWIRAGLATFAADPFFIEEALEEDAAEGFPTDADTGSLTDDTQQWIPNEWVGGRVHYDGDVFEILGNTETSLQLVTNPPIMFDPTQPYKIIVSDVPDLQAFLANPLKPIDVLVSYSRLPERFPAITLRLQSDQQAHAFIGESVVSTFDAPTETDYLTTEMTASYLLTIWTQNPQETLWLYLLLLNLYVSSQQQFPVWGLHDVTMVGSDVHPDLEFVPEQVYTRYLQITVTRFEEGARQRTAQLITDIATVPQPQEATISIPDP
jgi:hypothetical protein